MFKPTVFFPQSFWFVCLLACLIFLFKRFLISMPFWRSVIFILPYSIYQDVSSHLSLKVKFIFSIFLLFLMYLLHQTQIISRFKQLGYYSNNQDDSFKSIVLTTLPSLESSVASYCLLNKFQAIP